MFGKRGTDKMDITLFEKIGMLYHNGYRVTAIMKTGERVELRNYRIDKGQLVNEYYDDMAGVRYDLDKIDRLEVENGR